MLNSCQVKNSLCVSIKKNHRHCKRTDSAGEVSLAYKQEEPIRVEGGCQANLKGGPYTKFRIRSEIF